MEEKLLQSSSIFLLLKKLLNCTDHLERLMLYDVHESSYECAKWASPKLEHVLVEFATVMERFVALCFVGFRTTPTAARKVNRRLVKEVIPVRPSFWFYIDRQLPLPNDITVPRIHYDEIVNPADSLRTALTIM